MTIFEPKFSDTLETPNFGTRETLIRESLVRAKHWWFTVTWALNYSSSKSIIPGPWTSSSTTSSSLLGTFWTAILFYLENLPPAAANTRSAKKNMPSHGPLPPSKTSHPCLYKPRLHYTCPVIRYEWPWRNNGRKIWWISKRGATGHQGWPNFN